MYCKSNNISALSLDSQAITYDQIGNPLTYRDGMSFKWSGDRKLTSFTLNNGASYVNGEYVYDDSGIRVYKNINGNSTTYTYDSLGRIKNHQNKMFW